MKKTKIILKKVIIVFMVTIIIFISASCGKSDEEYTKDENKNLINKNPLAVAIIMGKHANAMDLPKDVYNTIDKLLNKTVYGGYACAIIADGTPTKYSLVDDESSFFTQNAKNKTILSKEINTRTKKISDKLKDTDIVSDTSEVDLLGAIREAKNALSSTLAKDIKNKLIVIVDTGISTCGDLNFLDMDFIYGKPEATDIINQLRSYEGMGVLPDLTGIQVTFIGTNDGLAEIAEPQKALTTDKKFIKNLWESIVKACGSTEVNFEAVAGWDSPNNYTEDAVSKYKYVSVVTFNHEKIIQIPEIPGYDPNNPDNQPDLPNPPNVEVKLLSATVGFIGDKSDYIDETNAKKILRPYADELKTFFKYYPDEKIWIVGTSATVAENGSGDTNLSLQRAETVKKTLLEFGVPADKLLTIGLGAKFPWHVNEFKNGNFDTNTAQENRAVWLLTTHSDKFNKLKLSASNSELLPDVATRFNSLNS